MGCDIHIWPERREGDRWVPAPDLFDSETGAHADARNYAVFSFLADVRNYSGKIRPRFAGRGLPADVDLVAWETAIREDQRGLLAFSPPEENEDLHSATHFTLAEIRAEEWPELIIESNFKDWLDSITDDPERIRILVAFDN